MTAIRWLVVFTFLHAATAACTAQAAIVISSNEVWDGIVNPRAADGVTLLNGVYTIPTSVTINPGVIVYLNDPNTTAASKNITWEFLPGAGGLTFGDALSMIDTYAGARNAPDARFTLNMNNNAIAAAVPGAGRIANGTFLNSPDVKADSMGITINSLANVTVGMLSVAAIDANSGSIVVNSEGTVNLGGLFSGDPSDEGNSAQNIFVTGEALVVGDIDTRAQRNRSNSNNGNVTLRALGQPQNAAGDPTANFVAANTITMKGAVNTNGIGWNNPFPDGPVTPNLTGNLSLTAAKVVLDSTFTADINENGTFNVVTGAVGPGFAQSQLFVNNSTAAPTSVEYSVFHDNQGPSFSSWTIDASGSWFNENNWNPVSAPAFVDQTVTIGSVVTAPRTIYLDQVATMGTLTLDTSSKVVLGGVGSMLLDVSTGSAAVNVQQGTHEILTPVTLADNATVTAAAGTRLDVSGVVNLSGRTLTVAGSGQVNLNNSVTGVGSVVNSGVLGTGGLTTLSGNLTSTGTLDFDISGTATNAFDAFAVTGTATLSGTLSVELLGGFAPAPGASFTVLTASSISAASLTLGGPDAGLFTLVKNPTSLVLKAGGGLDGDFNGDGKVDAADYAAWQTQFGGALKGSDLLAWQRNFGAGGAALAAVPEPAAGALLALSVLPALLRRRAGR